MKAVKCYRCGKEHEITIKNAAKRIKCSHCNAVMTLDYRSTRWLKYVRYIFVGLVVGIVLFCCTKAGDQGSYGWLLIVLSFALLLGLFADSLCLKLTEMIFGLTYVEYVKPDKKVKRRR